MPHATSKRLYFRGLPSDTTKEQLEKLLSTYGLITEVKILPYCAFVQFESAEDATRVVETYSAAELLGKRVVVEYAHPMRKDALAISSYKNSPSRTAWLSPISRPSRTARHPVVVLDLPRDVGWQELKDFGRSSGALVSFCDLDKVHRDRGFIEFFSHEDAVHAVQVLDGQRLGGQRVRVVNHQEFRALNGSYEHRTHGRSGSPRRTYLNGYARGICATERELSASHKYSSDDYPEPYPGTRIYGTSIRGRTWYFRRRRSQEDEYESFKQDGRTAPMASEDNYDCTRKDILSQDVFGFHQEASYSCHQRTWFTAAEAAEIAASNLNKPLQHHFDYYHQQVIHDAAHSDDQGFGEQPQEQWHTNDSNHRWPERVTEAGYDSVISDTDYTSRLDEAQRIQQRLLPYQ